MDSIMKAVFSETSKKLASTTAEAVLKTVATKGSEKIINSFNKPKINYIKPIEPTKPKKKKKLENIFEGTSIKFIH